MTDTNDNSILDNENNPLNKGRLKLVTKLLIDNKYELMDDLNYSRTTTQDNSLKNYSMNDNYTNQNELSNTNSVRSNHSALSHLQPTKFLSSLPSTSSSYLSLLPFMSQQEEYKTPFNNNSDNNSYISNERNKPIDSNILTMISNQKSKNQFKESDDFNSNRPLFIPKSTRLKAERVRIYLDYFYNFLEGCISLDNNNNTKNRHPDSSVEDTSHTYIHHYHEGVEGVYNPLQVIRNRKLKKKYHSELKPLRELTFTKVPLIAVVQFSKKPNRKLKWFVELSEKYSDLTWRTSHWNELRRPDGRRWIEDPNYYALLNRPTDTSFDDNTNNGSIRRLNHINNENNEEEELDNNSNSSFNCESINTDISSKTIHRKRGKIKKKLKQLKHIDNTLSLNKRDKEERKSQVSDNNRKDLLSNDTQSNCSNLTPNYTTVSSSTNSVNIINQSDSSSNVPSVEISNQHKIEDNLSSAFNKMEKIINKTRPKKFPISPKKLHNRNKSTSDTTNIKRKPNIITTLPTPTIDTDHSPIYNDNNSPSNASNYLNLPNSKDKNNNKNSLYSNTTKHLLTNSNEDKSSISLLSSSSSSSHISSKFNKNHEKTDSNSTTEDNFHTSDDVSSNNKNFSSNSVISETNTSNISSNVSLTSLSSDSSSDSSESSLVLNVSHNRNQRRRAAAPIALQEGDIINSNKPVFPLANGNKLNNSDILKFTNGTLQNSNYDRRDFINDSYAFIDDQLNPNSSLPQEDSTNEVQNSNRDLIVDEQLLQYWQDTRYILSTIAIMKHRRKTHDIVKKRAIKKRNETVKFEKDADYHIAKTKEIINKYDSELDKAIVLGNKWTSKLLNDYSIRVETLISSSDRILSDINTTLTLKLKLFQENTERFDNFKMVYSQRSTRLVYKLLEIFIIGILWTIWLLVITAKKIKFGIILILKIVKWMVW